MLRHGLLVSLLLIGCVNLSAQQPTNLPSPPKTLQLPSGTLPLDPAKFSSSIRDSYYHPDQLSGLTCNVSVDWSALFSALKQPVPADRMAALQGLIVHSQATRGKIADLTFDWAAGTIDAKEQMEGSLKQMIGGFYQMYWPMIASFPIEDTSEIKQIEPQANGGAILYITEPNANLILTVDKEHLPVHYASDSPAMKATFDLQYTPTPNPVPGDLNRLTNMNSSVQFGASTVNLKATISYQTVGGFHIPEQVIFGLGPSYSVVMNFSGCSVSQEISAAPEKK
jgi:hypothetical protein